MISHVYFDFFGTLVDYDSSVHPSAANAPHKFTIRAGLSLDEAQANELWQRAWTELDTEAERTGRECSMLGIAAQYAKLLADSVGEFEVHRADLQQLVTEYLDAWTADIRLAESAAECLEDLARDHTVAVVSNTHDADLVPRMLRRFGIEQYVSHVFASVDLGWRKPHPAIFEAVLRHDGIPASQAAFVGDNWTADVEGPLAAGMVAFYVGAPSPGRLPTTLGAIPALVRG
ncbi:MAG: HAD family hydrolase [Leucobacter sp.]|nr:HAD family hydrolase [Leucobacter sp.]